MKASRRHHWLMIVIALSGVMFLGWMITFERTAVFISVVPGDEKPIWKKVHQQIIINEGLESNQYKILEPVRSDVLTVSPWLAPIVWEGTFDPVIIDSAYKTKNLTIAATVFAVGKYTRFLEDLLVTAEQHFMVGLNVHYYIFTDLPEAVPSVGLAAGRNMSIIKVPKFNRWQEISLRRMEIIQTAIEEQIRTEAHYIYCLDVDMKFHNRVGPEILGKLVAAIHPWYYWLHRDQFSYERRPSSMAFIPYGQGDFYYQAAIFGGEIADVHKLTRTCRLNLEADKTADVEAAWQEESHLNWYLLKNKPTKLLSPEYMWDEMKGFSVPGFNVIRFATILKNNAEVRENV